MLSLISNRVAGFSAKARLLAIPFAMAIGAAGISQVHAQPSCFDQVQNTATNPSKLTIQQLGALLDNLKLGKNTITNNGDTYYTVNIKRGSWSFPLTISLSPNGNVIWITAPLTNIADPAKASPVALTNLLKKNTDLGPMFFEVVGDGSRIELTEPLANHDITVENLGANIESFLSAIRQTEPLWNDQVISPNQTAAAASAAPIASTPVANPFLR